MRRTLPFLLLFIACPLLAQTTENTLVLPPVIYLTSEVENRIYYDNFIHFTETHVVEVECSVGTIGEEYWAFTPSAIDEGLYRFSITIRDELDAVVESDETVLVVTRQSASSEPLRIMAIGDSLTAPGQYQSKLAQRMDTASISYTTLGTVSNSGFNYEGYGGNTYQRYLEGPYYFRSPFVYSDTGFDPERYFTENTAGVVPTLYLIFLGINDTFSGTNGSDTQQETRLDDVMARAVSFIDGMRAAAPGSDVGIILTPAGSSNQAAYDAAYGVGVYTVDKWQAMRQKLVTRYIETFGNREEEGIFLIPVSVGIDRVSDYTAVDPIHPITTGYQKIGDMIFGWLNYYLQDRAYPRWALNRLPRDVVLAGDSDPEDNPDGDPYDNRVEHIFDMDPAAFSLNPLTLGMDGLSTRFREGADVILEVSTDLSAWERWGEPLNEQTTDGFVEWQIPFELLDNKLFQLRY